MEWACLWTQGSGSSLTEEISCGQKVLDAGRIKIFNEEKIMGCDFLQKIGCTQEKYEWKENKDIQNTT